jgi:Hsp70 protein
MANCRSCEDIALGEADVFCPNCGAFALPVRLAFVPSAGAVAARERVKLTVSIDDGRTPELDDLRIAVLNATAEGEIIEDVEFGVLQASPEGGGLATVTRLAQPKSVPLSVVAVARRGSHPPAGPILARADFNQPPADLVVLDKILSADALRPNANGGGGSIAVRVRNAGGSTQIYTARLSIPSVAVSSVEVPPELKTPLYCGQVQLLEAWISAAGRRRLTALKGSLDARLVVTFDDGKGPELVRPLTLERHAEAALSIELRSGIRGLAGRRARLGAVAVNSGGASLRIVRVKVRRQGSEQRWDECRLPRTWERPLDPGERIVGEIRPWLTTNGAEGGPDLGAVKTKLEIQLEAQAEGGRMLMSSIVPCDIEVRAKSTFKGRICIDFGTTESAAAISKGPGNGDAATATPLIVELGQAGPNLDRDAGERFLETAIALDSKGDWHVGDDAHAVKDPVLQFRDLKWRRFDPTRVRIRSEGELIDAVKQNTGIPDIEEISPLIPLTAFLREVRKLIEEHPDVAAVIDKSVTTYATRPVSFADGQAPMLVDGFLAAGFADPRSPIFGESPMLIAESWSPVIALLRRDQRDFVNLTGQRTGLAGEWSEIRLPVDRKWPGPAHVIVYDVGGGSADMSVLRIEKTDFGEFAIKEVALESSTEFAGRKFSQMIAEVLVDNFPTDERFPDLATRLFETSDEFARAVRFLQRDDGALASFFGELSAQLGRPAFDEIAFLAAIDSALRDVTATQLLEMHLPILVTLPSGTRWSLDLRNLPTILAGMTNRFMTDYSQSMRDITARLRERAKLQAPDELSRLVLSGRGGAFPLARLLMVELWPDPPTRFQFYPTAAKSITSWGGLLLAEGISADEAYTFEAVAQSRMFRVVLPTVSGIRNFKEMDIETGSKTVAALLCVSELPASTRRRGVVVVRGAQDVDAPERFDPVPVPPGPTDKIWVGVIETAAGFRVAVVDAESRAQAIAKLDSAATAGVTKP